MLKFFLFKILNTVLGELRVLTLHWEQLAHLVGAPHTLIGQSL